MFTALLAFASRNQKCTTRKTLIDITNDNYLDIIGKNRPVYVRMKNNGCPFAVASEQSWKDASELYPNIAFAQLECLKNGQTCAAFGARVSPSHTLFPANSTEKVSEAENLITFRQASGFGDIIQEKLDYFSVLLSN